MGGGPGGPGGPGGMPGFGGGGGHQFHGFHSSDPFKMFEAMFGRAGAGGMRFGGMGGEDDDDDPFMQFGGSSHFSKRPRGSAYGSLPSFVGSGFSSFGRGGSGGSRGRKQPDAVIEIGCSLEDLYNGVTKNLKVTRNITSHGSTRQEPKQLTVEIKPGYKAGTKIRFAGDGDQVDGAQQDLVFVVKQKPHQYYERDGDDLIYKADITLQQALCGIKMTLPTLDNRSLEVFVRDQVISPNYVHRLPNEGMPKKGGSKGDMIVKFNIRFPTYLTETQRDQLKGTFKGTNWA